MNNYPLSSSASSLLVLSVLLAVAVPLVPACPAECSCHGTDQEFVLCQSQGASPFPQNLSPKTRVLTLRGTPQSPLSLPRLTRADLRPLTSLAQLTISFVQLTTVDEDAFIDLLNLQKLDLSHNSITDILPNTFSGLHQLLVVSLTNNPGLLIHDRVFWNKASVQELYMGGLGLKQIHPDTFYGLDRLKSLDVSANQLESFSPDILLQMPNLWSLDLSYNQFPSLDPLLEPFFSRLKRVSLGGNPWQCSCLVKWLKAFPDFIATRQADEVVCSTPRQLEHRRLYDVEDALLICKPPAIDNCTTPVDITEGDTLTVRCAVSGYPFPNIVWTLPSRSRLAAAVYPGMPAAARGALQLPHAPMSYTGQFTITATNGVGRETAQLDVTVWEKTTTTTTTTTSTTTLKPTTTTSTTQTPSESSSSATTTVPAQTRQTTITTTPTSPDTTIQPRAGPSSTPTPRETPPHPRVSAGAGQAPHTTRRAPPSSKETSDSDNTPVIVVAAVASGSTVLVAVILSTVVYKLWTHGRPRLSKVSPEPSFTERPQPLRNLQSTPHVAAAGQDKAWTSVPMP